MTSPDDRYGARDVPPDELAARTAELQQQLARTVEQLRSSEEELVTKRARIGAQQREVETLRQLLERSRERERQLLEELSKERRESMRLLQESEAQQRVLEEELRSLRGRSNDSVSDAGPRHSVIVRRSSKEQMTADTVRPPPVSDKANRS